CLRCGMLSPYSYHQGHEMTTEDILSQKLDRLIAALERIAPPEARTPDLNAADCFVWAPERLTLDPVKRVNRVDIALIRGVDLVRDQLVDNTRRFAKGFPANNVLLWGARGMGKSSLVKAAQASVNAEMPDHTPLKLIEIHREDIDSLPTLMNLIKDTDYRFILFCDDLSFDHDDTSYKPLEAALDGGVEGRPANGMYYATSNRRHLLPRDMIDKEGSTAINPSEAIEEKVWRADRFGLWLGFHKCSQDDYLAMVDGYAAYFKLAYDPDK